MEITNQNPRLKNLLYKNFNYQENPQTETQKQFPQQQTAFEGLSGMKGLKQLAQYGMAAVLMATPVLLTSCDNTDITSETTYNVTVKDNTEEYLETLISLVEQLIAQNDTYSSQYLDAICKLQYLMQSNIDANSTYYQNLLSIMQTYTSLLTGIKDNTELNADLTKQGLELMNDILDAIDKNSALLTSYGDKVLANMTTIQTAITNGNSSIIAVLELIWADINSGNSAILSSIGELGELINTNNDELLDKITTIYEDSELSAAERNEQILAAINEIAVTVQSVESVITATSGEVKEQIQSFLDAYNTNEITSQKMLELMYNALIEGNTLDKLQLETIYNIYQKFEDCDLSVSEALAEIAELLASINETLQGMSGQLNDILARITETNENIKAGNITIAEKLEQVVTNQDSQSTYLAELTKSTTAQNELLTNMTASIDTANEILKSIYEEVGAISYDELISTLNENNTEVIETINTAFTALGITIDETSKDAVSDIIAELESLKELYVNDQTKYDTIINILSSIDLSSTLTNSQLNDLIKLVEAYQETANDSNATQAEISAKLDAITNYLASIDATLSQIKDQLSDVITAIVEAGEKADAAQASYVSYLEQLVDNAEKQSTYLAKLVESQKDYSSYLNTIINQGETMIELLESANATLDGLNYTNLLNVLNEADEELASKLETMIENLGITINNNTNDAADQIVAQLKTIISQFDSSNESMAKVIELLSAIDLNEDITTAQLRTLISLVEDLNTTANDSNATQAEINDKLDAITDYLASIDTTLKSILSELGTVSSNFNSFYQTYENYSALFYQELLDINNNLSDIKANGEQISNQINNLLAEAEKVNSYLNQIVENQGNDITYEQLKELLGDQTSTFETMLTNMGIEAEDYINNKVTELIAAINAGTVDLTMTNNLLQTIIDRIALISGTLNSNDYSAVTEILQNLYDAYTSGNADMLDALETANRKLDDIYQTVLNMYNELVSLSNSFSTYASLYDTNTVSLMEKIESALSDLDNLSSQLSTINASITVNGTYLENVNNKADEIISILENLPTGLTKDELEELLNDAEISLETLLNNLGTTINDNTTDAANDIITAINSNKVDLTVTNNLLQTIISNLSSSTSQLISNQTIISELLNSAISTYSTDTEKANSYLEQIIALLQSS